LLPAIKTRCTTIKLSPINPKVLTALVKDVASKEKKTISEKVATRIVEAADGSARQALVILEQVIDLDTEEQQLNAVIRTDTKKNVADLCQAFLGRKSWDIVSGIIALMEDEPETIRRGVLGYMSAVYLKSRNPVAMNALTQFNDHWYDCGRAGLVRACGEMVR
jgi:DNA polymerase III gamma/tau subunit